MRSTLAICAALALVTGVLGACDHIKRTATGLEYMVTSSADAIAGRKEQDEPRRFAVAGPIGVDVDSFGGDVTIDVDERLEHAAVTVTRRAVHGYGRREEADASLGQISCSIEIVPGELGQVLQIRAATTHPEPYFQRVDVLIEAPQIEGVRVRTQNGDVRATRIRGKVDIVTDDGDVRVLTPYPMNQRVSIVNNSGDIDFRIRGESAGAIDGECVRGRVVLRATRGVVIIHPETSYNRVHATLNEGENELRFRATDGDIRIAVVPSPTQVGRLIVD